MLQSLVTTTAIESTAKSRTYQSSHLDARFCRGALNFGQLFFVYMFIIVLCRFLPCCSSWTTYERALFYPYHKISRI